MSRGGVLLAVALTLALSPAAAAGQSAAQPDLMILGRGSNTFTGNDVYDSNGVGQERSVIVDRRRTVTVRLQNDGDEPQSFTIFGGVAGGGISVRYLSGTRDVTGKLGKHDGLSVKLDAGASKDFRMVITADPHAPLGTTREAPVGVRSVESIRILDSVRIKITKTSTPI